MKAQILKLREVKDLVRNPYAWPGGYPKFLVTTDGGCLCKDCARKQFRHIAYATLHGMRDGWAADAVTINWEDANLLCDHCGALIQSAYGELDEDADADAAQAAAFEADH